MPDYDGVYEIINEEIEKCQPAVVSWITAEERKIAMAAASLPIPFIGSMEVPSEMTQIRYPKVDYEFFEPEKSTLTYSVLKFFR